MVGKTLGHYEILEPLGAGGMGEGYRARDTKLDRDVAIKVLPEDFATMPMSPLKVILQRQRPRRSASFDIKPRRAFPVPIIGFRHPLS